MRYDPVLHQYIPDTWLYNPHTSRCCSYLGCTLSTLYDHQFPIYGVYFNGIELDMHNADNLYEEAMMGLILDGEWDSEFSCRYWRYDEDEFVLVGVV